MHRSTGNIGAQVLQYIKAPVICIVNGREMEFASGEDAMHDKEFEIRQCGLEPYTVHIVEGITVRDGRVVVDMTTETIIPLDMDEPWVKEHIKKYGKAPDIFDGA